MIHGFAGEWGGVGEYVRDCAEAVELAGCERRGWCPLWG